MDKTIASASTVMNITAYTGTPLVFVLDSLSGMTCSLDKENKTLVAFVPSDTVAVKNEFMTIINNIINGIELNAPKSFL